MTKASLKMAKDLLDRFFRDAEGKTNRQIDVYFTLEDMGIQRDKADEPLEYLTSRGLINAFGPDICFLTDAGVNAISMDKDIGKLPKAIRDFAVVKPQPQPKQPTQGQPPAQVQPAVAREPTPAPVPKLPRSDMPRLTYTDADGIQHVVELGWACTIGRVEGNTIHLNDQRASKKHAELSFSEGRYLIKDLGAANGTLVNGSYIDEHVLEHSDQILIGRTTLAYTCPMVIHPPMGPKPGAEEEAPPPPQKKEAKAPEVMPTPTPDQPPPIRVVKGRPDSRRSGATPQREVRAPEPADLFDDVRPAPLAKHTDIPPFPPPSQDGDLFAEPARPGPGKRAPEDLFDSKPKRKVEDNDLFADTVRRNERRSDDLFADSPTPPRMERMDRLEQRTPRETKAIRDAKPLPIEPIDQIDHIGHLDQNDQIDQIDQIDHIGHPDQIDQIEPIDHIDQLDQIEPGDTIEPVAPIDPLAPIEEVEPTPRPTKVTRGAKIAPKVEAEPWSEDHTPPDAALAHDAKLLKNQPVQERITEPELPKERKASKQKRNAQEDRPEEAATLMVSRDDIFPEGLPEPSANTVGAAPADSGEPLEPEHVEPLEAADLAPAGEDEAVPPERDAAEADTNLELENEPGYPRPEAPTGDLAHGDELKAWGEEPVPLGSHPSFASKPSSGPAASLKGEELPEAEPELPDLSLSNFPALSGVRAKGAAAGKPESHFHKLIRYLRSHVERADLPDREALLDALDLLDRHPYIRVALNLSDTDRPR